MRQLSAILLIGLFAFSQYARQLSYWECKLSNVFKPDASQCDCDKKAGLIKQDSNQAPLSKVHTHIHLDEFFSSAREITINSSVNSLETNTTRLGNDDECEGNYSKHWRPPNT